MPNPHCPTKKDIDQQKDVFPTRRKDKGQHGHDKQPKYYVQAINQGQNLIQLWWTHKLHPHTAAPDFRPDAPMALNYAPTAPDNNFWTHFRHEKQLATLIAAAIERMEVAPWPS
jgi:hypothetical protein